MSRGRPKKEYVGLRFGLVTVETRTGSKVWVRCDCGTGRWANITNVIRDPPKGHSKCREFQYELPLDRPGTAAYGALSEPLESEK